MTKKTAISPVMADVHPKKSSPQGLVYTTEQFTALPPFGWNV